MPPGTLSLIALGLDALIKLWATHTGKPADWEPTPQDWDDLKTLVEASTPEAMKDESRKRLGIVEVM